MRLTGCHDSKMIPWDWTGVRKTYKHPIDRGNNIVKRLEMKLFHIRRYINTNFYYYYSQVTFIERWPLGLTAF